MYLGDFKEDGDIFFKFTTRAFATGIPGTLGDTPVLAVYIDEATGTEKTTAETYFDLDVDFDSKTGLNNVRIDLSGDAFFATGADYTVVITTGTVDSVSVVGEVVATFSIENRSMGQPSGATMAVDIAAIQTEVDKIGTIPALDSGAQTVGAAIAKLADDNGGANFDATTDSLERIRNTAPMGSTMVGTNSAALASVVGALDDAAAAGEVTTADTLMQYLKQLINILIGTPGIGTFPSEAAPANGVSLAEVIRAIYNDIVTDGVKVASINTDAVDAVALAADAANEIRDAIAALAITLPGQVAPPLSPTWDQAFGHLYKAYRNRKTQTATEWQLLADNESTVDQKATVSDDGTTAIKQEIASGP